MVADAALEPLRILSNSTSEHEVRFQDSDERVIKVTWPGFYGQVPVVKDVKLERVSATPAQYLVRSALQNAVFGEEIKLERIHVSERPSLVIGEPSGQPSLVVSQPWYQAADANNPSPSPVAVTNYMLYAYSRVCTHTGHLLRLSPARRRRGGGGRQAGQLHRDGAGIVPIDLQMAQFDSEALRQSGLLPAGSTEGN